MTAGAMKGAVMPFYIQYYLNSPDSITQFITAGTIAALLGAIFANFMTGKLCKVKLLKLAAFASMILHVVILFIPADQYIIALIVASAASFAHMVFTPILFSSVPDTVDYGIKRYGKGKMGMSVSGHLFSLKFGLAIGGAMAGWILGFTGYAANTEQIPTALQGIVFLMGGGMAAACAIILLLMTRYRLFSDSSRDVLTAKQP
jgi:GPH family glycoside/pentoside/hexuronide:cation symporter